MCGQTRCSTWLSYRDDLRGRDLNPRPPDFKSFIEVALHMAACCFMVVSKNASYKEADGYRGDVIDGSGSRTCD